MTGVWWKCVILCVAVLPSFFTAVADARGTWISDPAWPGPSQPPVGRSLFDYLFTETGNGEPAYTIPFPFARLVERIEQQLPERSASSGGIRQVLIPMGRSLVRNASRPDYFSSPRLVLAVDAPPRFDVDHAGWLLKDRLYIGYMEQQKLLEVISYNEAAGRFEFQLVENYGPDREPKVSYANRQLCMACHQNAAPIFSRQQWDETNANPAIDDLLERRNARRYGVPAGAGVDIPFAIDAATDRANYYAYYQLMWQQGCQPVPGGEAGDERAAVLCREALLRAVLRSLLTDGANADASTVAYQDHFKHYLQANSALRWPDGLLFSDPDIPNRNPLLKHAGHAAADKAGVPLTNVIGEVFDPLVPRPPLRWLDAGSDQALSLLVNGLAEFLAATDRRRLDQYLFDSAMAKQRVDHHELSCAVQEKQWKGQGRRFGFDCHASSTAEAGPVESLQGRFTLEQNGIRQATINRMSLKDGTELRNLTLQQVSDGVEQGAAHFGIYSGDLHARLPNGNALGKLVLEWQAGVPDSKSISARLSVLADFTLLDEALRSLVQQAGEDRTDALSSRPFRRASIMPALFAALGMDRLDWCCTETVAMPVAASETTKYQVVAELEPFYHYCAACHASASPFPANFLYGSEAQVKRQVSHCAERMYYRLSMARKEPGKRGKSPMPPLLALGAMGEDQATWAGSGALETLKDYVGNLLQQQSKSRPDIEQYDRRGFDQLRSCLPKTRDFPAPAGQNDGQPEHQWSSGEHVRVDRFQPDGWREDKGGYGTGAGHQRYSGK